MAVARATKRRIGILAYDDVQGLDIVGSLDVFTTANALCSARSPYDVIVFGLSASGSFRTESGLRLHVDTSAEHGPCLRHDRGSRRSRPPRGYNATSARRAMAPRSCRRHSPTCVGLTGLYALAESGLIDGRRATTHWRYAADVAKCYPAVHVEPDAIYVKADRFYFSAGVTSGVDLSLALVEEDLGRDVALAVARELVVYLKRAGGQMQYSIPLQVQTQATSDLERIIEWMLQHLAEKLTVEAIAERMDRRARHVTRRFVAAFGETPASFVERLRLDSARSSLTSSDATIADIAASSGYRSADAFGRAFEKRYGVAPTTYRRRFV